MEGIEVNEEFIGSEVIGNVAASKKNFLKERHTIKNMRKEIYNSKLVDRRNDPCDGVNKAVKILLLGRGNVLMRSKSYNKDPGYR